jgi:acetyltransferase-like isoleucine patch superfamily enzyme
MILLRKFYSYLYFIFLRNKLKTIQNVKFGRNVSFSLKTIFGGYNVISDYVNIYDSEIGFASYIGKSSSLPSCQIGAYCSIGHNIQVLPFTHPTSEFVSTHPSFFSLQKQAGFTYAAEQLFEECIFYDKKNKWVTKIGNDVWIGANVIILGGLEIGNGAIIAAGSVVTKNVKPFEIVAGVPAKKIKMRFFEHQVVFLEKLKWWEKDRQWLEKNYKNFQSVELLIEKLNNEKL